MHSLCWRRLQHRTTPCRLSPRHLHRHTLAPRSTGLGFTATNEVLSTNSYRIIDEADYKLGCRYTTPDRFNFHVQQPPGSEEGKRLGDIFDATYVNRVSERTAGLFDGMEQLLRSLALSGHPQVGAPPVAYMALFLVFVFVFLFSSHKRRTRRGTQATAGSQDLAGTQPGAGTTEGDGFFF